MQQGIAIEIVSSFAHELKGSFADFTTGICKSRVGELESILGGAPYGFIISPATGPYFTLYNLVHDCSIGAIVISERFSVRRSAGQIWARPNLFIICCR